MQHLAMHCSGDLWRLFKTEYKNQITTTTEEEEEKKIEINKNKSTATINKNNNFENQMRKIIIKSNSNTGLRVQ